MTELLGGLCAAARDVGHDAELERGTFPPPSSDTAYVTIPHEYYACEPAASWPSPAQRERTIALCVENPGTTWFNTVLSLAPLFPMLLAINRSSQLELRRRGFPAKHLQLGYTRHWDRWQAEPVSRPIDITYLGAADPRRDALIASYGRWWWHRRVAMLTPILSPKPTGRADYLVDDGKYEHLRRSKVLVNLHREGSASFEWVRVLQALANGCVVVSEPSIDHAPLVPDEHFLTAAPESIPHIVEGLLREPSRLEQMRTSAYEALRGALDMTPAVEQLVATAGELTSGRRAVAPAHSPAVTRDSPEASPRAAADDGAPLGAVVRNLATEVMTLRRSIQRLVERSEGRDPDAGPEFVHVTPAFQEARPRVSVTISLHNYEREVLEALASVSVSEFEDYEVLVLDDASTDGSLGAARDFLLGNPWMPAALLRHWTNRGLARTRNELARQARGELVFVLDADNKIYPTALGRLVEALERDPGASFAYPLIAVTRSERPVGLLSRYAWDPEGFRAVGNYIDAMALIRLDDLATVGGYTEDARLIGWEDFHLWCAFVEAGRRGTLVPQVLAQYRKTDHSMLAWTEADLTTGWSVLHTRFPTIVPSTPPR